MGPVPARLIKAVTTALGGLFLVASAALGAVPHRPPAPRAPARTDDASAEPSQSPGASETPDTPDPPETPEASPKAESSASGEDA